MARIQPPSVMRALPGRRMSVWVSVFIIGILVLTLLDRLEREAANSEAQLLKVHLKEIEMQLLLELSLWRIRGKRQPLEEALSGDPMRFMKASPKGYMGDCPSLIPEKPGLWCFDRVKNHLVYRPRFITEFEGRPLTPEGVWRWRLVIPEKGRSQPELVPVPEQKLTG